MILTTIFVSRHIGLELTWLTITAHWHPINHIAPSLCVIPYPVSGDPYHLLMEQMAGFAARDQLFATELKMMYCQSTIIQLQNYYSIGSSGRVGGGGQETWNLYGRQRRPSFLWLIGTGLGGAWPPRHPPPGSATEIYNLYHLVPLQSSASYLHQRLFNETKLVISI